MHIINKFSFINDNDISEEIKSLDINKPTTLNNIPAKILVQTSDICSSDLRVIFNNSIKKASASLIYHHLRKL